MFLVHLCIFNVSTKGILVSFVHCQLSRKTSFRDVRGGEEGGLHPLRKNLGGLAPPKIICGCSRDTLIEQSQYS